VLAMMMFRGFRMVFVEAPNARLLSCAEGIDPDEEESIATQKPKNKAAPKNNARVSLRARCANKSKRDYAKSHPD
jgi:hypothetical protein